MRSHAIALILAAGLALFDAAHASEQDAETTGSIPSAHSHGELVFSGRSAIKSPVEVGFGFSPFLEEGLVPEVPLMHHDTAEMPVPAYLRDFRGLASP